MILTAEQKDILTELINIGVGRASGMLNEMLQSHVDLQVPYIRVVPPRAIYQELTNLNPDTDFISSVQLRFQGSFTGTASLVFPPDSAGKLVDILTGEAFGTEDLDEIRVGTLTEVGNIVINGVMGSIANILRERLNYSVPTYLEGTVDGLLHTNNYTDDTTILIAYTRFHVQEHKIEGNIILFFELGSFDTLLTAVNAALLDLKSEKPHA